MAENQNDPTQGDDPGAAPPPGQGAETNNGALRIPGDQDGAANGNGNGNGAPAGAGPGAANDPPAGGAAAPDLKAQLDKAERERAETHDRLLRVAADFENYKKRARRDIDDAQTRGREQLLRELLPVLDNLERALSAVSAGGGVEALSEGVKLVEKQFLAVLDKFQVKRFDALHEPFDPAKHEAIQQVESAEAQPGAVAQVFARGYTIGERLLRPAMVAVAKARPAAATPATDGAGETSAAAADDVGH